MFFIYILMPVMVVSTILVHATDTQPVEMTLGYCDGKINLGKSVNILKSIDRESNLKYVLAIEKSSFWSEIKTRSLTISTEPQTIDLIDKYPDDLSDEELLKLKQICQNGLKCLAVNHLLILKHVMKPTDDGKTSVLTAITKITKVLTQYTTEYHEEKYQYQEVTDSDDMEKVVSSVTTILRDNQELCRINENTYVKSEVSSILNNKLDISFNSSESGDEIINENSNTSSDNSSNKTSDDSLGGIFDSISKGNAGDKDERDDPLTIVNNGNINFGTVKTYNINEGTMNNASVSLDKSKTLDGQINSTPTLDNTSTSQNNDGTPQDKGAEDNDSDLRFVIIYDPKDTLLTDSDTETVDYQNQGVSKNSSPENTILSDSRYDQVKSSENAEVAKHAEQISSKSDPANPTITDDYVDGGSTGVVRADNRKNNEIKENSVEDGDINYGLVKLIEMNMGSMNKGVISHANAENGIVNIGGVHNGKTNYTTVKDRTDNETSTNTDNIDLQMFAEILNNTYSSMLHDLENK